MPDPGLKQEIAAQKKEGAATSRRESALGSKTNSAAIATQTTHTLSSGPILKYPLDGQTSFPARIKFTIHQVDAYTIDTTQIKEYWDVPLLQKHFGKKVPKTVVVEKQESSTPPPGHPEYNAGIRDTNGSDVGKTKIDPGLQKALNDKNAQAINDTKKSGITDIKSQRVKEAPIIQIYMPQSLQINDTINYNSADLGPGGLAAVGAMNAGSSLVSAVTRGLSEGIESIFNLATGQISGTAAQVAGARLTQAIPKAGLKAAAATAIQTGINPGTRMIFDRPNVREFSFTFAFISTSAAEAAQVEQIIKAFRENMYPETIDIANGIPAGYKFPNLFQVEFQFLGADAKFPKMQKSYLRSCNVAYNPNSMTFHADGQPTEVNMTLVFQEYRALSKQDIQKGY